MNRTDIAASDSSDAGPGDLPEPNEELREAIEAIAETDTAFGERARAYLDRLEAQS